MEKKQWSVEDIKALMHMKFLISKQQEELRRMSGVLEQIIDEVLTAYALHLLAYQIQFGEFGSVSASHEEAIH